MGACVVAGVEEPRVAECICVCAGANNQAVTRSTFGALVLTGRRAARMSAFSLTSRAIIGRVRRETGTGRKGLTRRPFGAEPAGNAAGSGGFGYPTTPSLLIQDPSGPTWIRHASADSHDNVSREM